MSRMAKKISTSSKGPRLPMAVRVRNGRKEE